MIIYRDTEIPLVYTQTQAREQFFDVIKLKLKTIIWFIGQTSVLMYLQPAENVSPFRILQFRENANIRL